MPSIRVQVPDADALDLVQQTRGLDPGKAVEKHVPRIDSIPATYNTSASYRITVELTYEFTGQEVDSLIQP